VKTFFIFRDHPNPKIIRALKLGEDLFLETTLILKLFGHWN